MKPFTPAVHSSFYLFGDEWIVDTDRPMISPVCHEVEVRNYFYFLSIYIVDMFQLKKSTIQIVSSSFLLGLLLVGCTSGGRITVTPKSVTQSDSTPISQPSPKPDVPPQPAPPPPPPAPPSAPEISISAGYDFTCATVNGSAYCWGSNKFGSLGIGDESVPWKNSPSSVLGLQTGVKSISSGLSQACATLVDGKTFCWGFNTVVTGSKKKGWKNSPVFVPSLSKKLTSFSLNDSVGCGILDGAALCWGDNTSGKLGSGTALQNTVLDPVGIVGMEKDVTAISTSSNHVCGLKTDGQVWCWGWNYHGQLGNNSTVNSIAPVHVSGLPGQAKDVKVGQDFSCALLIDGTVYCWGNNNYGQLGTSDFLNTPAPSRAIAMNQPVSALSVGYLSVCAKTTQDEVYCWGSNAFGQLGDESKEKKNTPVKVKNLPGPVSQVTVGGKHACAVLQDGNIYCWGRNKEGQLGIRSFEDALIPTLIPVFRWWQHVL